MPEWIYARKRVELEKAVAVVLWRFGRNKTLLEISDKFHTGQATIVKYTRILSEILTHRDKLYCHYIGLPRGQRLLNIMGNFQRISKFPLIAAAIDETQVKLRKKPSQHHSPADYWNRHHDHALQLQGVVDSKRNFLDCVALLPGSHNDAYHLRISSLWHKMVNNLVFQETVLELQVAQTVIRGRGQNRHRIQRTGTISVKPFIIGDDACPLTAFLQKAFNKRRVASDEDRNNFDRCLRRSRVQAEHTFALLKEKWRILDTGVPVALEEVSTVIFACCCLHNFVNSRGVRIPPGDRHSNLQEFDPFLHSEPLLQIAESVHARRTEEGKLVRLALFQNWLAEGNHVL
ncbi:hypothetical protein R1flu_019258 [Riccia fluitans]|uniref:DDE Tnp4 domain-containing protein n=1 Tax=Riccia fluitans TaxID=41844 RepID=A0ABD1ZIH2_9MARC